MGIPREPPDVTSGGRRRDYTRAPEISKAYLLGIIHDATRRRLTYRIAQKSQVFLIWLRDKMHNLGINSWIYKEGKDRNVWILEFSNKHLDNVPLVDTKDKIDYLRGYFDAEGGIAKSNKVRFYVYYCQKNFEQMVQLKSFLDEIGIKTGLVHNPSKQRDPNFWRFYVSASSYRAFAEIVGSNHPDKWPILRMKI